MKRKGGEVPSDRWKRPPRAYLDRLPLPESLHHPEVRRANNAGG